MKLDAGVGAGSYKPAPAKKYRYPSSSGSVKLAVARLPEPKF